jgi:hypothetical protein
MFRSSGYWFAGLLVAAGFAFWPKYLGRLNEHLDPYTHFHAIVATAWCGLLIVQPFLIRAGRRELHRKLGALSYAIAPLLLVASTLLANARFRAMDEATFASEAASLYLPLSAVFLFGLSYALAMIYRKTQALHARFMIATGLVLVDPVVGRVLFFYAPPLPHALLYQAITFGSVDLILLALLWRPPLGPRLRRTFMAGAAAFPAAHLGWFTVAQSRLWLPLARWFRALPLT